MPQTSSPIDFEVSANVIDLFARSITPATVSVRGGVIRSITPTTRACDTWLMPGFVDAHIHVESSMLPPAEFARLAVVHGTLATVSDPHEIANVLGLAGVEYMIDSARGIPFHFCVGAPSCVPATTFETSGATLDAAAVARLMHRPEIGYLSEVMNVPGVLVGDEGLLAKIASAKAAGKPIDGHAPGLQGDACARYFAEGISTDHECFTLAEGQEKVQLGVKILIREGSAARNFEALHPLISQYPRRVMLCSDDKHPNDLLLGHMNQLAARAVAYGHGVFDVLTAACVNPVQHYALPLGLLRVGDRADFIEVRDLKTFEVERAWFGGRLVAQGGKSLIPHQSANVVNQFQCEPKTPADFAVAATDRTEVIQAFDGQLVTGRIQERPAVADGFSVADPSRDLLKITVVNRYQNAKPAVAFIRGFGLKQGAIASSVAHDSHNIVAVGTNDDDLCEAVNKVIASRGGLAVVNKLAHEVLPLPIAGLMSDLRGEEVAARYARIDAMAKALGSSLGAPFMTLSFMALLVIPDLKLSDKGLFDGREWAFV